MSLFQKLRTEPDAATTTQPDPLADCTEIATAPMRVPTTVHGVIRSIRIQPQAGVPTLQARIDDGTGELLVTFLGRRRIGGIDIGRAVKVTGVIGTTKLGRQMLNPIYQLLP